MNTQAGQAQDPPRKTITVQEALQNGLRHHNAGELREAAAIYRRVLNAQPDNTDALHLLGVVARQSGQPDTAIQLIRRAIAGNERNATYHGNLGTAYEASGRPDEALAAYRRAIEVDPDYADAHFKLAAALDRAGEYQDALAAYRRTVEINPDMHMGQLKYGELLRKANDVDGAIAALTKATELAPDDADSHYQLGLALKKAGRGPDCVASFRRAAQAKPDHDAALFDLTLALWQMKDVKGLLEACDECLAADPGNRRMLAGKIIALDELGDRAGADRLLGLDEFIHGKQFDGPAGYDSLAAFNRQLAGEVSTHRTLQYEKAGHATKFGKHTGDILRNAAGAIATLKGMMEEGVAEFLTTLPADSDHPFITHMPKKWQLVAWAIVMDRQGHQLPHIHPAAWISGVYYVQLPSLMQGDGNGHAGWIEFGRPQSDFKSKAEPEIRIFRPEEGLMFLFPSYLYHETIPYESDENRISVAFDVLPADDDYKPPTNL